jgi:hypothetical protein
LNLSIATSQFGIYRSEHEPDLTNQFGVDVCGRADTELVGIIASVRDAETVAGDVDGV